ncbi:MAG: hypothetical protein HQK88_01200 [Nitrospirae bacterium]|nr:hypothetical protein [Nitrospirota bacterium]MBF0533879.1 hypothetical protein [Nitrospirota bacterium]MBF0615412.1 hypothetical protein [Nitrospirota bacterium]
MIGYLIGKAGSLLRSLGGIVNNKDFSDELLIPDDDYHKLRSRYYSYKDLLLKNNELLNTLAVIEEEIENKTITVLALKSYLARIFSTSFSFIQSLNDMTDDRYMFLFSVLEHIKENTMAILEDEPMQQACNFVMPIEKVTAKDIKDTGGKAANLGELLNVLNLPTPRGFSIMVSGYKEFMSVNGLNRKIESLLAPLSMDSYEEIDLASEEIERLIMSSSVPAQIEEQILSEAAKIGNNKRFSVRSSAVGEDGKSSFAGQFKSILNVPVESLTDAYKQVVASKYGKTALYYRLAKNIMDRDIPMAVLVLEMVNARSAGVLYTLNPGSPDKDEAILSSIWGQGRYAVDGTIPPDVYILDRKTDGTIINRIITNKSVELVLDESSSVKEVPVPEDFRKRPAVSEDEIETLYDFGCIIEKHFETPQDIEWAIDEKGRVVILQARSLHAKRVFSPANPRTPRQAAASAKKVIIAEGETASRGVASGPVYFIDRFYHIAEFPKGAVAVAKSSSNDYVRLMSLASALVIETGSRTSHLATVAREFGIPMVINVRDLRDKLKGVNTVTVDADSGRIYDGRTIEVNTTIAAENAVSDEYLQSASVIKTAMRNITHLNLATISEADVSADDISTVHDIIRFVHEISVKEMFRIGKLTESGSSAQELVSARIPLRFYVIDLDGGVIDEAKFLKRLSIEHISSMPFRALWRGMIQEGVRWSGPVAIDMGGLASVMMRSFVSTGVTEEGGKVYVIITDSYINLSVKLAYHYSIIDSFCGESYINNYINFRFNGGGAGVDGRGRRALFIKEVTEAFGFKADIKGDLVIATLNGASKEETEEKLEMLGRLLGCSRQLDMAISTMEAKDWYVKAFLEGNYSFTM